MIFIHHSAYRLIIFKEFLYIVWEEFSIFCFDPSKPIRHSKANTVFIQRDGLTSKSSGTQQQKRRRQADGAHNVLFHNDPSVLYRLIILYHYLPGIQMEEVLPKWTKCRSRTAILSCSGISTACWKRWTTTWCGQCGRPSEPCCTSEKAQRRQTQKQLRLFYFAAASVKIFWVLTNHPATAWRWLF